MSGVGTGTIESQEGGESIRLGAWDGGAETWIPTALHLISAPAAKVGDHRPSAVGVPFQRTRIDSAWGFE